MPRENFNDLQAFLLVAQQKFYEGRRAAWRLALRSRSLDAPTGSPVFMLRLGTLVFVPELFNLIEDW